MTTFFAAPFFRSTHPGTFVWRDDRCVAFLSINPLAPEPLHVSAPQPP